MIKIGVIQLCSQLDPEENLKSIRRYLEQAKKKDIDWVHLPECFYSLSDGTQPTPYLVEQGNIHYKAIQNLAKDFGVYLIGGSAATKMGEKIVNRIYNFDPQGRPLAGYDKIHLFSINMEKTEEVGTKPTVLNESHIYTAGTKPQIIEVQGLKVGLGICFDVRFPEFLRQYAFDGAKILSLSSAFTVPTGRAHWHILMRARAVENQCYVVAAAQWGRHNEKISTYGHSLIISPWGEILADAGEGEGLIVADIDPDYLDEVRKRMSVLF